MLCDSKASTVLMKRCPSLSRVTNQVGCDSQALLTGGSQGVRRVVASACFSALMQLLMKFLPLQVMLDPGTMERQYLVVANSWNAHTADPEVLGQARRGALEAAAA
jgi:hypothetical protein